MITNGDMHLETAYPAYILKVTVTGQSQKQNCINDEEYYDYEKEM